MRCLPLLCLLLGTLAWGQEEPLPSNVPPEYRPPITRDNDEQQALPASASKVAPDAAVITINGLCAQAAPSTTSPSSPPCQTVITRAQFEKLTDALLTNMKPSMKRQLASSYPKLLAMAREAEVRGLEENPRFEERLAFARLQILSQELVRQIDEESAKISEKDIEDYYHNHAALFEQATLERIFIPNRKHMDPLPREMVTPEALKAQRKEAEEVMTRVAEELRARAAAGEDFVKLQKEAYAAAGATDVPPNPNLGQLRSGRLPPAHASAFDLKLGQVSQVLSDSTGHYIYKLNAKGIEPLKEVTDEIHKTVQHQHQEEAIKAVQRPITTEINEAYFGPNQKPSGPEGPRSK
jgi:ATP-dependent Clp protease ATP-binding subunit ClpA